MNSKVLANSEMTRAQLLEKVTELEATLATLNQEFETAAKVYNAFMPITDDGETKKEHPNLEYAAKIKSLEKVGGDFTSYKLLPNGDAGQFMVDVEGHGLVASFFNTGIKSYCDEYMLQMLQPTEFIARLYQRITQKAEQFKNKPTQQDTYKLFYDFALSATYIHYHWNSEKQVMEMRCSYTGIPSQIPLISKNEGGINGYVRKDLIRRIKNPYVPDYPVPIFESQVIDLHPGSRVYLFTDGLSEVLNPRGESIFDHLEAIINNSEWTVIEDALSTFKNDFNYFITEDWDIAKKQDSFINYRDDILVSVTLVKDSTSPAPKK